jgi:hypothetical protein
VVVGGAPVPVAGGALVLLPVAGGGALVLLPVTGGGALVFVVPGPVPVFVVTGGVVVPPLSVAVGSPDDEPTGCSVPAESSEQAAAAINETSATTGRKTRRVRMIRGSTAQVVNCRSVNANIRAVKRDWKLRDRSALRPWRSVPGWLDARTP